MEAKNDQVMSKLSSIAARSDVSNWIEFQAVLSEKFSESAWIFRGQENLSWSLVTTLERATQRRLETEHLSSTIRLERASWEKKLLVDFQRRAHHYVPNPPSDDEHLDWFAMMQHHGAPTRLLDWTFSPYVGLYFAMEMAQDSDCCIWAVDSDWLLRRARKLLRSGEEPIRLHSSNLKLRNRLLNDIIFVGDHPRIVVPFTPTRMNERVAAQQGVFLCSLSATQPFSYGLQHMIAEDPELGNRRVLERIVVKRKCRIAFLRELNRMNINRASLFPGLDGFARSLGLLLENDLDREFTIDQA